jgi:hypothetical protein
MKEPERVSVQLRGHDFTGLGFNVTGNMRDGIFIKDISNRGPAFESGKIAQGMPQNTKIFVLSLIDQDEAHHLSFHDQNR